MIIAKMAYLTTIAMFYAGVYVRRWAMFARCYLLHLAVMQIGDDEQVLFMVLFLVFVICCTVLQIEELMVTLSPVSYTHLDVYKRQVCSYS